MAKLLFNGSTHQITLIDGNGNNISSWAAYNNVDSHATLTHINNGTYAFQDRVHPHRHHSATADTTDGPYGMYGIYRFSVPGHPVLAFILDVHTLAMLQARNMLRWDA